MSNKSEMFKVDKEGYEELYSLADAFIATRSFVNKQGSEVPTSETIAAKGLQSQIDQAREDGTEFLLFSEEEVQFLAVVVS